MQHVLYMYRTVVSYFCTDLLFLETTGSTEQSKCIFSSECTVNMVASGKCRLTTNKLFFWKTVTVWGLFFVLKTCKDFDNGTQSLQLNPMQLLQTETIHQVDLAWEQEQKSILLVLDLSSVLWDHGVRIDYKIHSSVNLQSFWDSSDITRSHLFSSRWYGYIILQ